MHRVNFFVWDMALVFLNGLLLRTGSVIVPDLGYLSIQVPLEPWLPHDNMLTLTMKQ